MSMNVSPSALVADYSRPVHQPTTADETVYTLRFTKEALDGLLRVLNHAPIPNEAGGWLTGWKFMEGLPNEGHLWCQIVTEIPEWAPKWAPLRELSYTTGTPVPDSPEATTI